MRLFAKNVLQPAANKGDKLLIVTRSWRKWAVLEEGGNVYKAPNPRSVSFSSEREIGKRIVSRFIENSRMGF
jgi:hypothetical protein